MPVTLTLTNIPDDLYERLTRSAELNHRTVGDQAVTTLESALPAQRPASGETLQRAYELGSELCDGQFPLEEIEATKHAGRA